MYNYKFKLLFHPLTASLLGRSYSLEIVPAREIDDFRTDHFSFRFDASKFSPPNFNAFITKNNYHLFLDDLE